MNFHDLNAEQRKGHDLIVRACISEDISSMDGGEGLGRLQILLGAGGNEIFL